MREPIVAIRDVSFQYEGASTPALRNVSLTLQRGETALLLGPSGCGKSTLLLCLDGIIPKLIPGQFSGKVIVDGLDIADHEVYELAGKLGIVFQDPEAQFSTLYVEDEVAFGLENLCRPRATIQKQVVWALQQVGLAHKVGVRLDRLSGGEKQKVALASVLAMAPEILAFDAPTANLDPVSARDFWALLRRLKAELGKTMIIVEQQVDECLDMVDRLVLMNAQGQIVEDGRPRELVEAIGAEGLAKLGVRTPQIWEVVEFVRKQGLRLAPYPLTAEEACSSLATIFNGRQAPQSYVEGPGARAQEEHGDAIRVSGLSHTYPAHPEGITALSDVHLRIRTGDFCAIVGQNGAGKTTLAKYLINILEPPAGAIFLGGADLAGLSLADVTRCVGYVFQNPEHQFVEDSVYDELAYSLRVQGMGEEAVRARVLDMLDTFQLRALAHHHPFELSLGQKRRLSVATMLIVGPEVLILDEPTLGQDKATASALMDAMRDLNQAGKTIIFITHDMRLVAEHAKSVIVMAQGRVIFQGAVAALFDRTDVMLAAALLPPPLVQLVQRCREANPAFPALTCVRDFQRCLEVA